MTPNETGLITVQAYQTKYKLDDTFWTMEKDKPLEVRVYKIGLTIQKSFINVYYSLADSGKNPENNHFAQREEKALDKMARTKEELMKLVFNLEEG